MVLPIYIYGSAVLKQKAELLTPDYPGLQELISDMRETLAHTEGVGLAAPQVGHSVRLFITDGAPFKEKEPELANFQRVMINVEILEYSEEKWTFNEGCLSVPDIHEDVVRPQKIYLRYFDENFVEHEEWLSGIAARIVQHEYDHLEGSVFTEKLSPIRRKLISGKLKNMSRGKASANYKTKLEA
ncbi:MAG: peptide deformylase [Bacteroidales bacterium]|nr:peptide deformylase [Bacteroidales bacterium]MCL2133370.1 peptide deformylase [Bacteroidales bacterium]